MTTTELREHAKVKSIDWKRGRVTIELALPLELDDLPSVGDEVELSWLVDGPADE